MSVLKVKRNGVWEVVSGLAGGASNGATVYVQDDEPANASVGTLWLDTDEESGGGSYETPYFDLVEMGLPSIPQDGSTVNVDADCTSLREALASGVVKMKVNVNYRGYSIPVTSFVTPIYLQAYDSYQVTATSLMGVEIFVISVYVRTDNIQGNVKQIQQALPEAEEATF